MKKYVRICGIVMPSEKDDILKYNQYMKSDKMPYIAHAYMHIEHIPCGYSK